MLILRPRGRGNWKPIVVAIEGERCGTLLWRAGQLITLAGIVFRVSKVLP